MQLFQAASDHIGNHSELAAGTEATCSFSLAAQAKR